MRSHRLGPETQSRQYSTGNHAQRPGGGRTLYGDLRKSETGGSFFAELIFRLAVTKEKIFLWASADLMLGLSAHSCGMSSNHGQPHVVAIVIGASLAGDLTRVFALIVARWRIIVRGGKAR
jgi:hypothetical protein